MCVPQAKNRTTAGRGRLRRILTVSNLGAVLAVGVAACPAAAAPGPRPLLACMSSEPAPSLPQPAEPARATRAARVGATALVSAVAAVLPLPRGAVAASSAGFPVSTGQAGSACLGPYTVAREARWYVPRGAATLGPWALGAFARAGFAQTGAMTLGGAGTRAVSGWVFTPNPDPDLLAVQVTWAAAGRGRTAVAYVVKATWTPPVPLAATLPAHVASVTVTLSPGGRGAEVTRTFLRGPPVGSLVQAYRELTMDTRSTLGCPRQDVGQPAVTVRYRWASGSLVVREGRDSCGSAYVTGAGGRLLAVLYDSALSVMAVAKALLADPAARA